MNCCKYCFQDEIIKSFIESEGVSGQTCDFCEETDVRVVSTSKLFKSYFNILFKYYHVTEHGTDYIHQIQEASDYGDSLFYLVQLDWSIFNDDSNDTLFFEIMSYGWDEEIEGKLDETIFFSRITDAINYVDGKYLWKILSDKLINENRFFPNEELDHFITKDDLLNEIKKVSEGYSYVLNKDSMIYRARKGIHFDKDALIPKKEFLLRGGRANPAGIVMFYAAITEETAISEVRPYKGEEVTVATVSPIEDLKLVDLSHVKNMKSPFASVNLTHEVGSLNLLYVLQETLSRPIDPVKSEIDYVPSQYLTGYLKSLGYDGLVFKSSLGKANNLVIFELSKLRIEELKHFVVSDVEITFNRI